MMTKLKNIGGTCRQGFVDVSYADLVRAFGEPHFRNGDKITVEWGFVCDGVTFTIYDYKWASAQSDLVEHFHIGGFDQRAVETVVRILEGNQS